MLLKNFFQYAMNIHVLDKRNTPVPGAVVKIEVNGRPKAQGKTRGYTNAPLKLRFNTKAPKIRLIVDYGGRRVAEDELLVTARDATIKLEDVEMPLDSVSQAKFAHENWFAFIFGCVMLLLLMFSPVIVPSIPDYMKGYYAKVPLTMLALGASGFATALTGFILVQIGKEDKNHLIRAGGALAVFVIVFFWNPAGM